MGNGRKRSLKRLNAIEEINKLKFDLDEQAENI